MLVVWQNTGEETLKVYSEFNFLIDFFFFFYFSGHKFQYHDSCNMIGYTHSHAPFLFVLLFFNGKINNDMMVFFVCFWEQDS